MILPHSRWHVGLVSRWPNQHARQLRLGAAAALLGASILGASLQAQESSSSSDNGATDLLSRVRSQTTNLLQTINDFPTPELQLQALANYELELDQRVDRRELTAAALASERSQLARRYWKLRDYASAARLDYSIIDSTGNSKEAANAWFMLGMMQYGNLGDPKGAMEPFQNAREMLRKLDGTDPEVADLRAKVLGHTGDLLFVLARDQEAISCFDELVQDPQLLAATDSNGRLNANLQLARLNERLGNLELARQYQDAAYEFATKSPDSAPTFVLSLGLERTRKSWPNPDDPRRIKELERLWNDPRFAKQPEIFPIGTELTCHYFFARATPQPNTAEFIASVLTRLKPFLVREQLQTLSLDGQQALESCHGFHLLLGAEVAKQRRDNSLAQQRVADFKAYFAERRFFLQLPVDFTPERRARFTTIAQQLLADKGKPAASGTPPARPQPVDTREPTPARRPAD